MLSELCKVRDWLPGKKKNSYCIYCK